MKQSITRTHIYLFHVRSFNANNMDKMTQIIIINNLVRSGIVGYGLLRENDFILYCQESNK